MAKNKAVKADPGQVAALPAAGTSPGMAYYLCVFAHGRSGDGF